MPSGAVLHPKNASQRHLHDSLHPFFFFKVFWLVPETTVDPTVDAPLQSGFFFPRVRAYGLDHQHATELMQLPGAKVVHIMRHGQAAQQLKSAAAAKNGCFCRCDEIPQVADNPCPYLDDSLIDAELTELGLHQAASTKVHVVDSWERVFFL